MESHHPSHPTAGQCWRLRRPAGQQAHRAGRSAMSPQGSHHSSRFLQGHRRTNKPPLVRLLETRQRANGSLKETPRRQRLACVQPGNDTCAPSVAIKHPPWLRGVGPLRGVFSRGDTVTDCVLSVLQGSLGKKLTPDSNIKAPNNQGEKKKENPTKAHVYLLNKAEAKGNVRSDDRRSATKNGPVPGHRTQC